MTAITRSTLAVAAGLLLGACSSQEVSLPDDPLAFPIEAQELAYIPTYSTTVVKGWPKGRALDPYDRSRVRLGEEVHSYHVGRLPSKDRREMHEAHTVYRVEQDARWDTRLPATPMESRGVVLGVVEPSRNEVPKDSIVAQERQSLMAKSQALQATMTRLNSLQQDLEKKKAQFEKAEEESKQIEAHLSQTIQERNVLKEQLAKAAERIEELESLDRLRPRSASQGINSGGNKK